MIVPQGEVDIKRCLPKITQMVSFVCTEVNNSQVALHAPERLSSCHISQTHPKVRDVLSAYA